MLRLVRAGAARAGARAGIALPDVQLRVHQVQGDLQRRHTNKRVRLLLEPTGDTEDEDEEQPQQQQRGRRKKRKMTNARPAETVRILVGCLLSGKMYSDYYAECIEQELIPMHHRTFERYISAPPSPPISTT